jgi:hypothetical protein
MTLFRFCMRIPITASSYFARLLFYAATGPADNRFPRSNHVLLYSIIIPYSFVDLIANRGACTPQ